MRRSALSATLLSTSGAHGLSLFGAREYVNISKDWPKPLAYMPLAKEAIRWQNGGVLRLAVIFQGGGGVVGRLRAAAACRRSTHVVSKQRVRVRRREAKAPAPKKRQCHHRSNQCLDAYWNCGIRAQPEA